MTGADSPVMAASFTEATPSMTSPSDGMKSPARDQHDVALAELGPRDDFPSLARHIVEALRHGLGLGFAQAGRLRLAAPLRHGLGEIGEQHGEPQPEIDLEGPDEAGCASREVAQKTGWW